MSGDSGGRAGDEPLFKHPLENQNKTGSGGAVIAFRAPGTAVVVAIEVQRADSMTDRAARRELGPGPVPLAIV